MKDEVLKHNKTSGIIVVNQTLVLQNLRENQAGAYKCVGENTEGTAESNVLELKIKCESSGYFWFSTKTKTQIKSGRIFLNENIILMSFLDAPKCREPVTKIYGVSIHEILNVTCDIDAEPPATEFDWTFNSSTSTSSKSMDNPSEKTFSALM